MSPPPPIPTGPPARLPATASRRAAHLRMALPRATCVLEVGGAVNGLCVPCAHRALKAIPGADIKFVSGGGEISGESRSWLKARS